jgi:uncharacterized membrane protein YfcA
LTTIAAVYIIPMAGTTLIILCGAAFIAGFIDAIVGGGGLIQTPAGLIMLPSYPVATVIGSLKIPAFSGTFIASIQYLRKVKLQWLLAGIMAALAFASAYAGSALLTRVDNSFMKPLLLVVLIALAIYTYTKKDFGQSSNIHIPFNRQLLYGIPVSIIIGFYDGFIGPGTGSFLVLAFIAILGMDFLKASAHAKLINLFTNFGSICLFLLKGKILWAVALPMAAANATGGFVGARLAINKGNGFIRVFFLIIVIATLIRFGYDVVKDF